jgi:Tfp pilus assembly protein PilO
MTTRDRTVLMVVVAAVLVIGSWIVAIQPKRAQAAKLGGQIAAAQSTLDAARAKVLAGKAAKASFGRDYAAIARLGEAVPSDDNMPSLIYQLQSAATATGVDFRVLKLAPAAGGPTVAPTPSVAVGPAGFPTLPFTFTFQGNFFHLSDFFARLERFVVATNNAVSVSGRLMSLNSISLGPAGQGFPQIVATISATTYLVPSSEGLLVGATPAGPGTGTATQAAASHGSSVPTAPAVATFTTP